MAVEREFLRVDEAHDDNDRDETERRNRRQRGGERRIGDSRQRADHHVLRIAGDGGDAAAIGGGRGRDEIGQRIAVQGANDLHHDRRHHEADRVIDQESRQNAGKDRHCDQKDERRAGMVDGERAERPECAGHLEVRDDDHHAEQKRDRIEVDRVERVLEAQGAERDHRRAAEKRDPRAIETQAGNAAGGDSGIGENQDRESREAFQGHSPGAPSIAGSALSLQGRRGSLVARLGHE